MPLILIIAMIMLTGCGTMYGPAGEIGGFDTGGYSDKIIDANTATISFSSNRFTNPQMVRAYALYRAAQVTIANGYHYFIVTASSSSSINTTVKTSTHPETTVPPKLYRTYYTKTNYQSYSLSRSHTATCFNCLKKNTTSVMMVIKMFREDIPTIPNRYDADDVIAQLGPVTF